MGHFVIFSGNIKSVNFYRVNLPTELHQLCYNDVDCSCRARAIQLYNDSVILFICRITTSNFNLPTYYRRRRMHAATVTIIIILSIPTRTTALLLLFSLFLYSIVRRWTRDESRSATAADKPIADKSRGTNTALTCCSPATTAIIVVVAVVVANQCL